MKSRNSDPHLCTVGTLRACGRQVADAFREHLRADEGAEYDQMIEIDLNELQPQACSNPSDSCYY